MTKDERIDALERVAASAENYLEVLGAFLVREEEEGRGMNHYISPRVKMATETLMRDLASLKEEVVGA